MVDLWQPISTAPHGREVDVGFKLDDDDPYVIDSIHAFGYQESTPRVVCIITTKLRDYVDRPPLWDGWPWAKPASPNVWREVQERPLDSEWHPSKTFSRDKFA